MKILGKLNNLLTRTGFQLTHLPPQNNEPLFIMTDHYKIRQKLINHFNINKILDIGANTGQFVNVMRNIGFEKKIFSFEPLSDAYAQIQRKAENDNNWDCFNFALGEQEKTLQINIAGNSYSSSILQMLPIHESYDMQSKYIGVESISVKTLDSIFTNLCFPADNIYAKIDTQGYEKEVLNGAKKSLSNVLILQLELSLQQLYKDEPLFDEIYNQMTQQGFEILTFENGISDFNSGRLMQVDVLFLNRKLVK